ncbi:MAG: crossover junction endodeoxyribonuclease RuvC [Chitinophagales bacterium]|nr:crossover junction endodeoxyribonuclease RuvC [Chitinophagales bacterium]MDW8394477.1 crossover junction endodeoxyribonuclease RuvC [Chitinophagales bacterium]
MTGGRRILGVDPGTNRLGYAIIEEGKSSVQIIGLQVLQLRCGDPHFARLETIRKKLLEVCRSYRPQEMAVEAPFYGKNVQSMLKLGRAQGVAITVALSEGLPVFEYAPRKIKHAITGNGNAGKQQLARTLGQLLNFSPDDLPTDATDALGVALCHCFQQPAAQQRNGRLKSWHDFLRRHPERLLQP